MDDKETMDKEILDKIKEASDQVEIPESISPAAMEQMLNEAVPDKKKGPKRAYIAAGVAACLFLICGIGIGRASLLMKNSEDTYTDSANSAPSYETADVAGEAAESDSFDDIETDEGTGGDDCDRNLGIYNEQFKTPSSYDEYYKELKKEQDAFKKNQKEYTKDGDLAFNYLEEAASDSTGVESETAGSSLADEDKGESHSDTVSQEKNVTEGDVVKTDGQYIYRLSLGSDENYVESKNLIITKVSKGKLMEMSNINLADYETPSAYSSFQNDMYLCGDYLILFEACEDYESDSKTYTNILIFDISNKEKPVIYKKLNQSGYYETSRISDGYLYTLSSTVNPDLSKKKNRNCYIPMIDDKLMDVESIYYEPGRRCDSFYSYNATQILTSVKLDKPNKFTDAISVTCSANDYYVGEDSIYLYEETYDEYEVTEVTKVGYKNGKMSIGRTAVVPGDVYGRFAFSEYEGYLRIVGHIPARIYSIYDENYETENAVNAVYIFDKDMILTGKLTGIAPNEEIYAARYDGDTGYFVTFRNTDPVFTVDLSDPAKPRITDAIELTGFSSYLHIWNKDEVLGIGKEVDPETGEIEGIKLSMFDVSDKYKTSEKDYELIIDSTYSPVFSDPRALLIDKENGLIGFTYENWTTDEGTSTYILFEYDEDNGFRRLATYNITNNGYMENVRGVRIGDYFYLVTDNEITSYEIGSQDAIDKCSDRITRE